jgi:hypothetical protein
MSSTPPSPLSPADNPGVTANITLLQGIINRLATNSASCKTWCISLVTALVALTGTTRNPNILAFALVPIAIFAFIDTMYLAQERAFRRLFSSTVELIRKQQYTLDKHAFSTAVKLQPDDFLALFSWSILPVYGGLAALYYVAKCKGWIELLVPPG